MPPSSGQSLLGTGRGTTHTCSLTFYHMSAPDTLLELGQKLGIEDLSFQDNDTCQLIVGENLTVTIELIKGEEAVYLYGDICPKPASPGTALFERLMGANLFGAETGGATLALNPGTNTLVLWKKVGLDGQGGDALLTELQEFSNWLLTWQDELSGSGNAAVTENSEEPASGAFLRV